MANGFCPALLTHIDDVAEGNSPGRKMHTSGFLQSLFCCQNSSASVLNDATPDSGHLRPLTVAYRERPTVAAHVQDVDDCDVNRVPVRKEFTLPNWLYRQTSFFLDDGTIRQYCDDASETVEVGQPATPMMREIFDLFIEHANVLLKSINTALVTRMATGFGENVTIGSDAGKVININKNGADMTLNDGIVEILADLRENEMCDEPCIVGGGLMSNYEIARMAACCSQAGVDANRLGIPKLFFDKDTQTIWGQDSFAVIAPGSVKFLGYNRFGGRWSGEKGGSIFFTAAFPVNEFDCPDVEGCLRDLMFDVQMKYIDCPQEISINGVMTAVNRGWQIIISKYFQLFIQPVNLYAAADDLFGTNGTLLYFATNESDSPGGYAYA